MSALGKQQFENLVCNMSGAGKTANFSFLGIIHIFRPDFQMLLAVYTGDVEFYMVYYVTHTSMNSNKLNLN